MKVIFVDNLLLKRENDTEQFILQPHLGLISLIAVLENKGYTAKLCDPKIDIANGKLLIDENLYQTIATNILKDEPDVVGFTSLGCNFICTLKIARYLKQQKPLLPILLGGPHGTVLHKEIISAYTEFDVIVRNEAEHKIIPVLENLFRNTLETIEGITFRKNGKIVITEGASIIENIDELPFPAYHAFPIEKYSLSSLRVEAGRGCPFACTFCSTATFFGRSYRLKAAHKLCSELDYLHKTYGINDFGLTHDLFTVNRTKIIEFCKVVEPKKYTWRCSARMDCVDEELLSIMRQAGCVSIYYGIETGSQRMQKISKKKLDLSIFDEVLATTLALNIVPTMSFIVGYPEETQEDVNDTLDMISNCLFINSSTNLFLQLHLLTPEPGTALYYQFKNKMGYDDFITDFNFPTLEADDSEIMEKHPEIFMNHHYYQTVLPRHFFVITASLFEVLLSLDITIKRYLLSHYENKLSKLNTSVYEWAAANNIKSMTNNLLALYISQQFSSQHVLTSLLRYRFELISLLNIGVKEEEEKSKIRLQKNNNISNQIQEPSFRWLKSIHNCPEIIKKLEANKKIPQKLLNNRSHFIIHLVEDKIHGKIIEYYEMEPSTANILQPIEASVTSKTDSFLFSHQI